MLNLPDNLLKVIETRWGISPDAPAPLRTPHLVGRTPITDRTFGTYPQATLSETFDSIDRANKIFPSWRDTPAPQRGELIRIFGEVLRNNKQQLGKLVTLETGKILSEGLGEVQEMIDVCDFAVGLSRQLYGLTITSERPGHRMMETWHPRGPSAIITAFNFPVAVWAWNAALALVCGNPVIWKPSEKTPLTALAVQLMFEEAINRYDDKWYDLSQVLLGDARIGEALATNGAIKLVSATGSTKMGYSVAAMCAARLCPTLLELGGNNAAIVTPSADLNLACKAILFAAVGTAGQRCTTLRRLFVHEKVYDRVVNKLTTLYSKVRVGDPFESNTLIGPLIDFSALRSMMSALTTATKDGGKVHFGFQKEVTDLKGEYVWPALVEMSSQTAIVQTETFAPILYVMKYQDLREAIALQNAVSHGLSSSIFTTDVREAELFMSSAGSDCGIANVNIGPSGAEIGGAFGGEKATGGGRESGSDSWKAYMRRATNTVNYTTELPLAQGVKFDV